MKRIIEWAIIAVTLLFGIPLTMAGEWVISIGIDFLRYNDLVIVGIALLTVAVVMIYRQIVKRN